METRLASARASVAALNSVLDELKAKVERATAERQILYAKHQKIQDFKKLAVLSANRLCNTNGDF